MKYNINGMTFKTKKAIIHHIRALRDRYADLQPLTADDFAFMLALLQNHESAEIKVGCGVASMHVRRNPYGNRGFWLRRVDGTETDFSFYLCLDPKTKEQHFRAACRQIIAPVIIEFKQQFFTDNWNAPRCPFTGELLRLGAEAHVDHAPPNTFDVIFKDFVAARGIDINAVEFVGSTDGRIGSELADKQLASDFLDYHNARAELRVISKTANLSIIKADAQ
jgi:hypothetical protein